MKLNPNIVTGTISNGYHYLYEFGSRNGVIIINDEVTMIINEITENTIITPAIKQISYAA